nr:ORF3 [Torque teno felis virus]
MRTVLLEIRIVETGDHFYQLKIVHLHRSVLSFYTSYTLSFQETAYGDRCRASMQIQDLFQKHQDPKMLLTPKQIIKRDQGTSSISCLATSTQMESSKTELLNELLSIIEQISDVKWGPQNDLDISLSSSETSSTSEGSSEEEFVRLSASPPPADGPPTTRPKKSKPIPVRKLNKYMRYTPF